MACASGYGGFIDSVLSWEGWLPLSRLNFSTYLTHMSVVSLEVIAAEQVVMFSWTLVIYKFLAFYVIANAVGFLLAVSVEFPMVGLEKVFLR